MSVECELVLTLEISWKYNLDNNIHFKINTYILKLSNNEKPIIILLQVYI